MCLGVSQCVCRCVCVCVCVRGYVLLCVCCDPVRTIYVHYSETHHINGWLNTSFLSPEFCALYIYCTCSAVYFLAFFFVDSRKKHTVGISVYYDDNIRTLVATRMVKINVPSIYLCIVICAWFTFYTHKSSFIIVILWRYHRHYLTLYTS